MEKKMKTYPGFYRSTDDCLYLYLDAENYYAVTNAKWRKADGVDILDHENDINATREYLKNTYGEVKSPEHVEFIIELAELHGFDCGEFITGEDVYFYTGENSIDFTSFEPIASNDGKKQITIPLPPKADIKKWTPDFYDLGEPPKHFDCVCNKCGGKCCTGQCGKQELSEWPQIGDEVCWDGNSYTGIVKAISEDNAWCRLNNGKHYTIAIDRIKKPKTPDEEWLDNAMERAKSMGLSAKDVEKSLLSVFKKKPQ